MTKTTVVHPLTLDALPVDVYIARCAERTVLYVGITSSLGARMKHHQCEDRWWSLAESLTIERMPNRQVALQAESRLIEQHDPPYNRVLHPTGAPHRQVGSRHAWWLYRDEDILLLALVGWTKWELQQGLGVSLNVVDNALYRLRRSGRLRVEPALGYKQRTDESAASIAARAAEELGHEPSGSTYGRLKRYVEQAGPA